MNIAIIGTSGCGKTSYLNRIINGEFTTSYRNTEFTVVHELSVPVISDSGSTVSVNIHDTNGCELTIPTTGIDGYIVMFDKTSKLSYITALIFMDELPQNIPRLLCGNKVDSKDVCVKAKDCLRFSVKSCHNFEEPLRGIMSKISGKEVKFSNEDITYRR